MWKIKKYKISSLGIIFSVILFLLCGLFYYICSYYLNIETLNIAGKNMTQIAKFETFKDVLLVILSICGTNLLLSVLIEVKSKNQIVEDVIKNDVISCPKFFKNIDDDKKHIMFNSLEEQLFFKHKLTHDMFNSIRDKINGIECDYYYESCDYTVSCNVYEKYIEKEITRTVSLKSFDKNCTIKEYSVGNCSSKKIDGMNSYILESLEINGKKVNLETDVKKVQESIGKLDAQNEYDVNSKYIYTKQLKVNNETETTIIVKCKTRTTIDDKCSTFRVKRPCKNFSLNYSIKQHEKYRLAVDAFGFLDSADNSANNTSYSNINIKFRDWIFKCDGVVVIILDKY